MNVGIDQMFEWEGIFLVTYFSNFSFKEGFRFNAFHNEKYAVYAMSAYNIQYLTSKAVVFLTTSGMGCVHGLCEA